MFYLECAGNTGVAIVRWISVRNRIGKGKSLERIVFRKVNIERDYEMVHKLQKLLEQVIGH